MLPLTYRLRNPPAVFVGRDRELSWLDAALARAPVVVLRGPEGVGKTAAALKALQRRGIEEERAVMVNAAVVERPLVDVTRALAFAEGITNLDWSGLLAEPDMLVATALEMAEKEERTLLLDGLGGDLDGARHVLSLLAAYARRSRWLVTTRASLELPDAPEQVLELGTLPVADLTEIVRGVGSGLTPESARAIAEASEGLPSRARELALSSHAAATERAPERQLPAPCTAALALAPRPVSVEVVAALADVPIDTARNMLADAETSGRLEHIPSGWMLPEREREAQQSAMSDAERSEHASMLTDALATSGKEAARWLDAITVAATCGLEDRLTKLLEARGPEIARAGFAPELWKVLETRDRPELAELRLRCAVVLGGPDVLRRVAPPESPSVRAQLDWAASRVALGDLEGAAVAARKARAEAEASGDADVSFEALVLEVRVLANQGELDQRLALLEAADPPTDSAKARRDIRIAQCKFESGDHDAAAVLVRRLVAAASSLDELAAREVGYGAARVLYHLGELREASEALQLHGDDAVDTALYERRQRLTFRAAIALDRGELGECGRLLARLRPYVVEHTLQYRYVALIDAARRLAQGDFRSLGHEVEQHLRYAQEQSSALLYHGATVLRVRIGTHLGEIVDGAQDEPNPPAPYDHLTPLTRAWHRAARGEGIEDVPEIKQLPDLVEVRVTAHLVRATASLVAGDAPGAIRECGEAVRLASRQGFRLREVEARTLRCDALLCAGDHGELMSAVDELAEIAGPLESAMVDANVRFFRAVAGRDAPDPNALESIAALAVAPTAARRCRALLGAQSDELSVDAVDRAVLAKLRASWDVDFVPISRAPTREVRGEWRSGWGVDERTSTVWLPDGTTISLARRAQLYKLLLALVSEREPTKEDLVQAVWHEREYHPLRHDNRLQAAIRQLRHVIEDDPKAPKRVVTWEDGYAVGETEPATWLRTPKTT